MNRIYHQTKRIYDSSVRSSALAVILSAGPSVQQITNIIVSTVNQTDIHLATYVLGTMQDLARLNPTFRYFLLFKVYVRICFDSFFFYL